MSNGINGEIGISESIEKLRLNGHFSGNGAGVGIVPTKDPMRIKMARKQSSPMMPAFMVSAPGKVIVFGEHAVVHGKVRKLYTGGCSCICIAQLSPFKSSWRHR